MGLSLEIYMEKIGRNLVCNSFYIESEGKRSIGGTLVDLPIFLDN
jgi:hypothetical protein